MCTLQRTLTCPTPKNSNPRGGGESAAYQETTRAGETSSGDVLNELEGNQEMLSDQFQGFHYGVIMLGGYCNNSELTPQQRQQMYNVERANLVAARTMGANRFMATVLQQKSWISSWRWWYWSSYNGGWRRWWERASTCLRSPSGWSWWRTIGEPYPGPRDASRWAQCISGKRDVGRRWIGTTINYGAAGTIEWSPNSSTWTARSVDSEIGWQDGDHCRSTAATWRSFGCKPLPRLCRPIENWKS